MMIHNNIYYTILSLLTDERRSILEKNLEKFPFISVTKSINGYDIDATLLALKHSGLIYKTLEFPTYGTLANFLTKYNIIKYQIMNELPYVCFIEDDLLLDSNFTNFIENHISLFQNNILNIIRLDNWGEGYITSLKGAINIIDLITKSGIVDNIDNQLRKYCGKEYFVKKTPWKLMIRTNRGDCLKTKKITRIYST
jgi:GR25 family glycosyltransferase involved in LPS biosynthesis